MSFFDDHEDEIIYGWQRDDYQEPRAPRCKFCGSTDVRWRQQTGRWVLFSTTPGVEHNCRSQPASADEFDEVTP